MIRVFNSTDRDFTSNGNAVIVPIKARVKNNNNGDFTLELTCESRFYKYLNQGDIIVAPTPQGEQAFRIGSQLQRKGDRITLKAYHVFYDAQNLVIADSYAVNLTCEQALNHFNAATDTTSPFKMHSDITSLNTFRCVRKSLGEAISTVLERWGGYLKRDNWDISILNAIGRDIGVTIRYAKNLKELTASYDFSGVATKILPVGKDGILLPERYVESAKQYDIPYTRVVSFPQDINEDDYPTEADYRAAVIADLRTQAQATVNKTCIPVITYTLKGKPEKVQDIGDVIEVIDERIGVNITTQVIGYEWDVITESYTSLTFGNFGNTLSGLMAKVNSNTTSIVNEAVGEVKQEVKTSIDKLWSLLQGSFIIYRGYDILILDKIPEAEAENVIKFDKDGISISSNGVDGDYSRVYDIKSKNLTVPSITLNGADLGTILSNKIDYNKLKQGKSINITRDGDNVTIDCTVEANGKGSPVEKLTKLRVGNKVYIISTGGGLEYWIETEKSISQKLSRTVVGGWTAYDEFLFAEQVSVKIGGRTYVKANSNRAICALAKSKNNNNYWWNVLFISSVANDVTYQVYEYGSLQTTETYKYTTTAKGVTLYISGFDQMFPADYTLIEDDGLPYIGQYESEQEAYEALIEISGFRTTDNQWTGMGIDQEYIFYGGQTDAEATDIDDLPYRVTSDGIVNGKDFKIDGVTVDNVRDVKVNGSSVVTNKTANIDLTSYATKNEVNAKQDILNAGTNITIGSDGKTISARDTTYSTFDGATSSTSGTSGLVPAPSSGDQDKVLCGDGTWQPQSGGLTPVEIEWSQYQQLTPAQKADPTINYYVKNCPDDNYLTIENGKLCIVYEDGQ